MCWNQSSVRTLPGWRAESPNLIPKLYVYDSDHYRCVYHHGMTGVLDVGWSFHAAFLPWPFFMLGALVGTLSWVALLSQWTNTWYLRMEPDVEIGFYWYSWKHPGSRESLKWSGWVRRKQRHVGRNWRRWRQGMEWYRDGSQSAKD